LKKREPHRLNVVGDFYVAADCCISCGIPTHFAPNVFRDDDEEGCYVAKQPSPEEMEGVLEVFSTQEVGCVRYRGHDPQFRATLERIGAGTQCDVRLSWRQRLRSTFRMPT
jgi:ferredoxin